MKYVVIAILICGLVGAGYYFMAIATKPQQPATNNQKPTTSNQQPAFGSIKDALTKAVSLKCEYKDDKGIQTTTYIKAGSVRVMTTKSVESKTETNDVIMKDKTLYMWNPVTKKGFKYNIQTTTVKVSPIPSVSGAMKESVEPSQKPDQSEGVLAMIEKFKDACKPTTVEDSVFVPPTDVSFQDVDAMMKGVIPSGIPSGIPNEDAIKQMMQQSGASQGSEQ